MMKKDSRGKFKPNFSEVYLRNIAPADLQVICGLMEELDQKTATQAILAGIRSRVQLKKDLAVAYSSNQKLENRVNELEQRFEQIKDRYKNILDLKYRAEKEKELLEKEIGLAKKKVT